MEKPDKKLEVVKGKSFQKQYEEAKVKGKLERKTYRIHTWSEDNAHLVGQVVAIGEFKGGKFDVAVNSYTLKTDEGLVSCILGTATDGQLEGTNLLNTVVHFEYCGQKELGDGRKVNIFNVDILS